MKRERTLKVGRFKVTGEYEAVPISEEDGSWGMSSQEWERLELAAAIAVFQRAESIEGEEMRFARKAMGLRQPEMAALLDVATETVSRWETGADPIRRLTQLAVLLLLERTSCNGAPVPLAPENDTVRIVAA